ncbi:hypothetical protein ACFXPT_37515 [Streptomyces goshikiensis]|uniref:hypothetical protein n=1 Tax=Streptomyces goshikiensis TaxID=1942 RepID=UPI0036855E8B
MDSGRSEEHYRSAVRERLELKCKPGVARVVAEAAIRAAALAKAHTADLVNVALEASQCEAIVARRSDAAREWVAGMLEVVESEYQSLFAWIKQPARRATWFRAHAERMEKVDGLGDAAFWVGKTPSAGMAALAERPRVLSAGEIKDIAVPRRTAMAVCCSRRCRLWCGARPW